MAGFVIRRSCLPALALAAAGCSDEPATPAPERTLAGAPTAAASNPAPDEPFRYTHLSGDGCTVIKSVPDEAGYFVQECAGEGGYRLRHSEADLRQDLVVLAPGGGEHELGLTTMAGGAFNSLGDTVEWRGEAEGGRFTDGADCAPSRAGRYRGEPARRVVPLGRSPARQAMRRSEDSAGIEPERTGPGRGRGARRMPH